MNVEFYDIPTCGLGPVKGAQGLERQDAVPTVEASLHALDVANRGVVANEHCLGSDAFLSPLSQFGKLFLV